MNKTPVIKVENVIKEFKTSQVNSIILKDINIDIFFGEFVILFGPSGCGKSTLLNCIAGLEVPTKGKVFIRGQDLSKLTKEELAKHRGEKIGMIFQQFNVLKSLNVIKNIALPQIFKGVPKRRRLKRAHNMLKLFEMEKFANHIRTELSGGQQQRIAIARALVNNPWILIADEPTGNLDSKTADEIMELLKNLNEKSKRTIVLVTHNPEHLKYADKIVHMKDGEITNIEIINDKSHIIDSVKEDEEIKL
jgi:putative ABC transport system ATP-binding protein